MKLHTEIITICDYATLSKENKLSINGIFDELRVLKFPGGIPRAFLVATLKGKPDKSYKLTLKLEDEGRKKDIQKLDFDIRTSLNGKNNFIFELVNLGFDKEGEYRFAIYEDEDEVGSTALQVIHVQQKEKRGFSVPN